MYMGDLFAANAVMMILVIVGGALYTAGAMVYGLKRPNPLPGLFGFHEIFHTCTVLAFLCHWTAILLIAMDPIALLARRRLAAGLLGGGLGGALLGSQLPRAPAHGSVTRRMRRIMSMISSTTATRART